MGSLLTPAAVVLRAVPLAIDPAEVRAFQGYRPLRLERPRDRDARLDEARRTIERVARPAVAYRVVAVAGAGPDHLELAGGQRLAIPAITAHWGAVEQVAAAVVTVGDAPDREVLARRAAGDPVGAADLDCAASAAAECLAEWVNDELCRQGVAAGLRVTNRVSPGMAGWRLADQAVLLDVAGAGALDIRRVAAGGVAPAKTISFLVGVGVAARVDHYFVQCRRCWVDDCRWRRMPAVFRVQRQDEAAPGLP